MPIKIQGPKERPEAFRTAKKAYYGSAQEMYHVEQGDVWGIEDHRLLCGDVLRLHQKGILAENIGEVDAIYTDCPWTASIYRQFYTNANDQPEVSFLNFIEQLVEIVKIYNPNGIIFMESGLGLKDDLVTYLEEAGANTLNIVSCTYAKRHIKYALWIGSFNPTVTLPPEIPLEGHHENQVVISIARAAAKRGVKFFDPLCGEMTFLIPAARLHATVYGCELIPRKFAEGLRNMSRIAGQPARLNHYEGIGNALSS